MSIEITVLLNMELYINQMKSPLTLTQQNTTLFDIFVVFNLITLYHEDNQNLRLL